MIRTFTTLFNDTYFIKYFALKRTSIEAFASLLNPEARFSLFYEFENETLVNGCLKALTDLILANSK